MHDLHMRNVLEDFEDYIKENSMLIKGHMYYN